MFLDEMKMKFDKAKMFFDAMNGKYEGRKAVEIE
jgi:hypothetical protein